jgi:hypothetical protein
MDPTEEKFGNPKHQMMTFETLNIKNAILNLVDYLILMILIPFFQKE